MNLDNFDPETGTFREASTVELRSSEGQTDMEYSIFDYVFRGTASAATSAAVGILNTGVAFGETLGMAGEDSYIDEEDAVSGLWGEQTGDFYSEHKTGIDAAGMVAGSFVPGLGAVKMLRVAQRSGKIPAPVQAKTGLKNPDIILGSKQIRTARQSVYDTNVPGLKNSEVLKSYKQGVGQAFMESAAFDVGVVAAMNQNTTLNPDDADYLDSAKNVFIESLPFTVLGGALGGGLEILRAKGAIKQWVDQESTRTNRYKVPMNSVLGGMTPGDKFIATAEDMAQHKKLKTEIDETDTNAIRSFEEGEKALKQRVLDISEEAGVKNKAHLASIEKLMNTAGDGEIENIASILSGVSRASDLTKTDFGDLTSFYDKVRGPTGVIKGDNFEDIARQINTKQEAFQDTIRQLGADDLAESMSPLKFQVAFRKDELAQRAQGFAYPREVGEELGTLEGFQPINLNVLKRTDGDIFFVPDFGVTNQESMFASFEFNKKYFERQGKVFDQDFDQYQQRVMMHELAHVKTNTSKLLNTVSNAMAFGKNQDMLRELVGASVRSRKAKWEMDTQTPALSGAKDDEIVEEVMNFMQYPTLGKEPAFMGYLGKPEELLADGASYMVREETRQIASKQFPELAKLFNQEGGIAKAWDDTRAFWNTRTGKVVTSDLPGINDVSRSAKLTRTKKGDTLSVPELGRSFTRDITTFSDDMVYKLIDDEVDYLDFDAQWNIMDRKNLDELVSKKDHTVINDSDLPLMEKVSTTLKNNPSLIDKYRGYFAREDGSTISTMSDVSRLYQDTWQRKARLRDRLLTNKSSPYINEHKLSKILNTSEEFGQGINQGDAMLYGKKNFAEPELIKMSYKHKTPADYKGAAVSMQGYQYRNHFIRQQNQSISAELMGDSYDSFVDVPWERIYSVSPTSQRASLTANLRPDFTSLREFAQYTGKQVRQQKSNEIQTVDERMAAWYETFNRTDAQGLRIELAQTDNLARRNWYYTGTFRDAEGNAKYAMVSKQKVHEAVKEFKKDFGQQAENLEFSIDMLDDMDDFFVQYLRGSKINGDSAFVELSDEVGRFRHQMTREINPEITHKQQRIGQAMGKDPVRDPNVVYTPPRDLRNEKFHAFVEPTEAMAGSDSRRYMVFGADQAEFNSKIGLIQQRYGSKYRIVTQDDVSQYKRLMGDYDQNLVFDEIFFDSNLPRMGKSSELFPNLDLENSSVLDRYRSWEISQREGIINSAVELKYDDLVGSLKEMDKQYSKIGRTALGQDFREQDSIWKDTLNTMLDTKRNGSMAEQMFVKINDFIGNISSDVMDSAVNALRPRRTGGQITNEQMENFNRMLEERGLEAPTRNAVEAITTSPNIVPSHTSRQLVRTMSNLTSLSMLRMDWAHSFIQLISTPILGLPVLKELQQSLRGTDAGKQLENMTTVVNPSSGMKEPTPMKLFMEGSQKFFTAEGKEFVNQLKSRNIISDYLRQYLDTMDFSALNGNHTLKQLSGKMDQFADHVSKWSFFTQSEEFTRFQVAWAAKRMAEIGGKSQDEMWPIINSTVDKVHGVYVGNQRPQLFRGVLGQSIGLYQTYFFNFMQNMMKYSSTGENKSLMTLAGMQSSIFGVQSWPGFENLNQLIGETNEGQLDLFNVTDADNPDSLAAYFMYGLGSHSMGTPIDFYSRGDLDVRHPTVLPTSPADFPAVSTIAKAVGNMYETGSMVADENVPVKEALMHGLAHNGLNRPLQGLGQIMRNRVTSNNGQVQYDNIAYTGDNIANSEDIYWGSMFARMLGAKPLDESITMNAYFRDASYDANTRRETTKIGKKVQLNIASGQLSPLTRQEFMQEYESIGGDVQNFNAYWARQLQNAQKPEMEEFRRELDRSGQYTRMLEDKSVTPPWQQNPTSPAIGGEQENRNSPFNGNGNQNN